MEDTNKDRLSVYEIGYLIVSSLPEEKLPVEVESIKKIVADSGAELISEGNPELRQLAYTIRRKTLAGLYEKYDQAYFGWIKFEVDSGKVLSLKKSIESIPSVLRMLLITTVRENTYLGKTAPAINPKADEPVGVAPGVGAISPEIAAAPASVEEMDKSIDNLVKEA